MEAVVLVIGITSMVVTPIVLVVYALVVGWIDAGRRMRGERGIVERWSDD